VNILSTIQAFNNKLQSAINGDRFGISQTGRQLAALHDSIATLIIIIIDCSISMQTEDYLPNRLEAAKDAAIEYLSTLVGQNANANIAVIAFNDEAKVMVTPTAINNSMEIIQGIRSIRAEGSTNIGQGLQQATSLLHSHIDLNGRSQIILLTDGFGNCPISIPDKLKQRYGAVIDVIGIGGSPEDVNESLLRKVATTEPDGTNHYRFIADARTLKQHYRQLATGLIWKGDNQ